MVASRVLPVALMVLVAAGAWGQGLVGTWQRPGIVVELRPDGAYTWRTAAQTLAGRVQVQGDVVRFLVDDRHVAPHGFIDYRFQVQGDVLRLGDVAGGVTDFQRLVAGPAPRGASAPRGAEAAGGGDPPGPESTRRFLALLEGYPSMPPDSVARTYARLDASSHQNLLAFPQLHVDLVRRACEGSLAGAVRFRGPAGPAETCADLAREREQTTALGATLGRDLWQGYREAVREQQQALTLSLRCGLGLTPGEACQAQLAAARRRFAGNQAVLQGIQQANQMSHDTATIIIDNMGGENHFEWKTTPGP